MTGSEAEPASGSTGKRASVGLLVGVVAAVVLIDQLTKAWAVSNLSTRTIPIFWTLQLRLAYNTGMAFGTGRGVGPIIGAFAMVVVVVLLVSMRRGGGRASDLAVGLVVGGAIGNLADRLFRGQGWLRGAVVDFIDFQWFPIFNVADMAITVGGALLLLNAYRTRSQPARPASAPNESADTAAPESAESEPEPSTGS